MGLVNSGRCFLYLPLSFQGWDRKIRVKTGNPQFSHLYILLYRVFISLSWITVNVRFLCYDLDWSFPSKNSTIQNQGQRHFSWHDTWCTKNGPGTLSDSHFRGPFGDPGPVVSQYLTRVVSRSTIGTRWRYEFDPVPVSSGLHPSPDRKPDSVGPDHRSVPKSNGYPEKLSVRADLKAFVCLHLRTSDVWLCTEAARRCVRVCVCDRNRLQVAYVSVKSICGQRRIRFYSRTYGGGMGDSRVVTDSRDSGDTLLSGRRKSKSFRVEEES